MRDYNPLMNAVIRDRNVMAVEDPLVDLLSALAQDVVTLQKATSAPSSVPTSETPASKPSESPLVNHGYDPKQYRLTVQTSGSFKSMWFTAEEWEEIRRYFSMLKPMPVSQETSTESKAGDPGPASQTDDVCEWCWGRRDSHYSGEWEKHHSNRIAPSPSKESGERL